MYIILYLNMVHDNDDIILPREGEAAVNLSDSIIVCVCVREL